MRIWSKLCGPETCPKMFINSFMHDPFALWRHARGSGHPGRSRCPWTPACAGVTGNGNPLGRADEPPLLALFGSVRKQASIVALLQLDVEPQRAQLLDEDVEGFGDARLEIVRSEEH